MHDVKVKFSAAIAIILTISALGIVANPAMAKPAAAAAQVTNPVPLPAGWTASQPVNNMVLIQISGSADMVIVGVMDANQPEQIATMLAQQVIQGYTIASTAPAKRLDNGMYLVTSQLNFADGRKGLTIARAALRPDGKTAMAAIITANPNDMPGFQTRVTGTTDTLKALIAGASLPISKR